MCGVTLRSTIMQNAEKTLSLILHQPEVNVTEKVTLNGPDIL